MNSTSSSPTFAPGSTTVAAPAKPARPAPPALCEPGDLCRPTGSSQSHRGRETQAKALSFCITCGQCSKMVLGPQQEKYPQDPGYRSRRGDLLKVGLPPHPRLPEVINYAEASGFSDWFSVPPLRPLMIWQAAHRRHHS